MTSLTSSHRAAHAAPVEHVALRVERAGLRVGATTVFSKVDLTLPPHGVGAVVGGSGSGKTSLLLAIAGRMRLTSGFVELGPTRVNAPKPERAQVRALRRRVAVARIADLVGLDPELTLARNVADAADWVGVRRHDARDHLEHWWDRLGYEIDPRARLSELPAVEATSAHLVLAMLGDPEVIVLDDVSSRLQIAERRSIWAVIREIAQDGPLVVGSTMDGLTLDADVVVHLTREHARHAAPAGEGEPDQEAKGTTEARAVSEPDPEPDPGPEPAAPDQPDAPHPRTDAATQETD